MDAISIVQPRRPVSKIGWRRAATGANPILAAMGFPFEGWEHANGLFVISAVEVANEPGKPSLGPEYHLSLSMDGRRCTAADAIWALAQFGLQDAKEDNHVPSGLVRNFWRPVADGLSGYECPCVDDEPAIREDRGDYTWRGVTK